MKARAFASLGAAALCVACISTSAGLRDGKPVYLATTSKNARQVAGCIVERWELEKYSFAVLPREFGESVILKTAQNSFFEQSDRALIDIDNLSKPDNVKLYLVSGPWLGQDAKLLNDIKACI